MELLENIDWVELREQKEVLLNVIKYFEKTPVITDKLDGIVSLIDNLQDFAVDVLEIDDATVFNLKE